MSALLQAPYVESAERAAILQGVKHGETLDNGLWIPGPLFWLWHCTETFDNHWLLKGLSSPYRAFPQHPYFPWMFYQLLAGLKHNRTLMFPKSREMMASWAVMGFCAWMCEIYPQTRVVVQAQKEEKAAELVKGTEPPGYVRTLYERQPLWLKEKYPIAVAHMSDLSSTKFAWANGSVIHAVGKGADQVRQHHPTIYFCDEAAHVDDFEGSLAAAAPVTKLRIAVSSAGPGFFGDVCSEE